MAQYHQLGRLLAMLRCMEWSSPLVVVPGVSAVPYFELHSNGLQTAAFRKPPYHTILPYHQLIPSRWGGEEGGGWAAPPKDGANSGSNVTHNSSTYQTKPQTWLPPVNPHPLPANVSLGMDVRPAHFNMPNVTS
jgi:hypothetical protein